MQANSLPSFHHLADLKDEHIAPPVDADDTPVGGERSALALPAPVTPAATPKQEKVEPTEQERMEQLQVSA